MKQPRQHGTVLIEFTLCFLIFWVIFIGILEFGRTLLVWNTAGEATRIAARMASICTDGAFPTKSMIAAKVEPLLNISGQAMYVASGTTASGLELAGQSDWLNLSYLGSPDCDANTCEFVQARLTGIQLKLEFPGVSFDLALPENRTTVVRENYCS